MSTTAVYDHIIKELEAGELSEIQRKVWMALKATDEKTPITRAGLIHACFGYHPTGALNGNVHDRKIRKAIEMLRKQGFTMIVSSSGQAGYWIDTSRKRAEEMAGEMEKRSRELHELAEKIRAVLIPVEVPERVVNEAIPVQMEMEIV